MGKLSLWRPTKSNDFNFIDKIAREGYHVGSVGIFIHKYAGIIDQGDVEDKSQPSAAQSETFGQNTIQDMLWAENRNRKYEDDVYELRGYFTEVDSDFDMLQFGLAIADGSRFITFHLNEMIDLIGRKLMSGDVIELPNLRDDALLDEDAAATNRWFEITDGNFPTEGFSPLWWPHLWRIKAKPLIDAPEFRDITRDADSQLLKDFLTTFNTDTAQNEKIIEQAESQVPERNFETRHIYVVPGDEFAGQTQDPWIFAGDGDPPNGAVLTASLTGGFPGNPAEGDYVLRTDYEPPRLFKRTSDNVWQFVEFDLRRTWSKAHRILESHINNDNITTLENDTQIPEKQPISKAIKPREDF